MSGDERPGVLLVSGDAGLVDRVRAMVPAPGGEADLVVSDRLPPAEVWEAAAVVLVGGDAVAGVARGRPARRGRLLVVTDDPDDQRVWRPAAALAAEHVVVLPDANGWLASYLRGSVGAACGTAPLVAVVGGSGGVGASVLAAALGVVAAARGRPACLVDLDPLSAGADLLLGAEAVDGLRWDRLAGVRGRVDGAALWPLLPRLDDLAVLAAPRDGPAAGSSGPGGGTARSDAAAVAPEAVSTVLAALRQVTGLVVADLPRSPTPASRTVPALADRVLVVVAPTMAGLAAAERVVDALGPSPSALAVAMVARMSGRGCLPAELAAQALGVPLAGELRRDPFLDAALARGEPPGTAVRGPLARCARGLLADLDRVRAAA